MVGVVAHERGEVEGHGEAGLPVVEEVVVALVRLLGGPEARELAHRPEPGPVHGRVGPPGERVLAGQAQGLAVGLGVGPVQGRVEGLHLPARDRGEEGVPPGRLLPGLAPAGELLPEPAELGLLRGDLLGQLRGGGDVPFGRRHAGSSSSRGVWSPARDGPSAGVCAAVLDTRPVSKCVGGTGGPPKDNDGSGPNPTSPGSLPPGRRSRMIEDLPNSRPGGRHVAAERPAHRSVLGRLRPSRYPRPGARPRRHGPADPRRPGPRRSPGGYPRPPRRDHRRGGRGGRARHRDPGRGPARGGGGAGPDRSHGDPPPGDGGRGQRLRRLVPPERQRGDDRHDLGGRVGDPGEPGRDHQHPQRGRGPGRRDRLDAAPESGLPLGTSSGG